MSNRPIFLTIYRLAKPGAPDHDWCELRVVAQLLGVSPAFLQGVADRWDIAAASIKGAHFVDLTELEATSAYESLLSAAEQRALQRSLF